MSRRQRVMYRTAAAGFLVALVAACGGGAEAPSAPVKETLQGPSGSALPSSYTIRPLGVPEGSSGRFPTFSLVVRGQQIIDSQGRSIAHYRDASDFEHAMYDTSAGALAVTDASTEKTSHPYAANEHGWVVGSINDRLQPAPPQVAFAWSQATGTVRPTEKLFGFFSSADFINDDGQVSGRLCRSTVNGLLADCGSTFVWDSRTSALRVLGGFSLKSMNSSGDMLGFAQPPDCDSPRLGIMRRNGTFEPLLEVGEPQLGNFTYLADDGTAIVEYLSGGAFRTFAITAAGSVEIGRGVAQLPAGATVVSEVVSLNAVGRAGHAAGINTLGYTDGTDGPIRYINTPFVWRAADGVTPIAIEGTTDIFIPTAINRHGIVVGGASGPTYPPPGVVWSKETGGRFLETLLPAEGAGLQQAWAIGDSGHIAAFDGSSRAVVLTPRSP
jgi:hypothetical protein